MQKPDNNPFIWIRCVGAGRDLKHSVRGSPRTTVEEHWSRVQLATKLGEKGVKNLKQKNSLIMWFRAVHFMKGQVFLIKWPKCIFYLRSILKWVTILFITESIRLNFQEGDLKHTLLLKVCQTDQLQWENCPKLLLPCYWRTFSGTQ